MTEHEKEGFEFRLEGPEMEVETKVETTRIYAVSEAKVSTVSTSDTAIPAYRRAHTHIQSYARQCPDVRKGRNQSKPGTGRNPEPALCFVCRKPSAKFNKFAMRPDPRGVDRLVHVGCLGQWHAWIRSRCHRCGEPDRAGDAIGPYLDGKGGDTWLHQACWPVWSGKQLVQINALPEKERRLVEGAFGIINEEQERK